MATPARQVLLADDAYRAAHAVRPLAVEHGFGKDGQSPPLALDLPGGQVELAGYVDRIDQTAAGDLVVIDYKTGRSANYCAFPPEGADTDAATDLTEQGRHLQLPLYALVARRDFAGAATPLTGVLLVRRRGRRTARREHRRGGRAAAA